MTWHPREGRSQDGGRRGPALSRRAFLASGLALGGAATLAAGGAELSGEGLAGASVVPLARPTHPVTWSIYPKNKPIASNLKPERNATLQLYNWVAYINQKVVDNFEKAYKCKVEITTFQTMSEAIDKLRTGELSFDVFVPTVDVIGDLVLAELVQPLNHSYIPNISQAWTTFLNPFYDQGWRYTVPYTIWTTGIAWRKDKVDENPYAMTNAYTMPWQSKYKGKVAILDDYREGMALGMLKSGNYNLNTSSNAQIQAAKAQLERLNQLVKVQIDNNDYQNIPNGRSWIHQAWSGDMAASPQYLPKGTPASVIGYWFPSDGKGPVGNDTMVVLKSSKNPVLAHLFLNYLLDVDNALENISYNGYTQPLTAITPQKLVQEKLLPTNLMSTAVTASNFTTGVQELELSPAVNAVYEQAWNEFSGGL